MLSVSPTANWYSHTGNHYISVSTAGKGHKNTYHLDVRDALCVVGFVCALIISKCSCQRGAGFCLSAFEQGLDMNITKHDTLMLGQVHFIVCDNVFLYEGCQSSFTR